MPLPMIPADKANHAVYGSVIFMVAALPATVAGFNAALPALAATVAFAVGKEVYDWASKKGIPDSMDVVATVAGAAPGLLLTLAR